MGMKMKRKILPNGTRVEILGLRFKTEGVIASWNPFSRCYLVNVTDHKGKTTQKAVYPHSIKAKEYDQ